MRSLPYLDIACPINHKTEQLEPGETGKESSELPDFAYILPSSFHSGSPQDKWISNSRAGTHICNNCHSFSTFRPDNFKVSGVGQSHSTLVLGHSDVKLWSTIQGHTCTITLHDVIYCPDAAHNLMSISRLDAAHWSTVYKGGWVIHSTAKGSTLATGLLYWKLTTSVCKSSTHQWGNIHTLIVLPWFGSGLATLWLNLTAWFSSTSSWSWTWTGPCGWVQQWSGSVLNQFPKREFGVLPV